MISNIKRAWYILDEIAVATSSAGLKRIPAKAVEAMKLLPEKPTPDECAQLYEERNK